MKDEPRSHPFRDSSQDVAATHRIPDTPQTRSPAYRLAFTDTDFLMREELRPVRLQLELLKPQMVLDERGINSTIVLFGGARIPEPAHKHLAKTEVLADLSCYYEEARRFARIMTERSMGDYGRENVIVTGGGPGVMEAGNRGACDIGAPSIGMNIVLPHEQAPNPYVTPDLCFNFHYFATRKIHLVLRSRALAIFPGGFGTLDEFFEVLTLIQTGRMERIPLLLFGKDFWDRALNLKVLEEEGTISPGDTDLFTKVDTAEEGWEIVRRHYNLPRVELEA